MILDEFVPDFSFNEVHSLSIQASPGRIFRSLKQLTPADVPIAVFLMRLRSLPAGYLYGKPFQKNDRISFLENASRFGFLLLAEREPEEIVLGIAGQFWKPGGGRFCDLKDAGEFRNFHEPGFVKVGWNFSISSDAPGAVLRTETRILATDESSRRKFRLYWLLVRPGSGWIRRAILKAVKQQAETQ